MVWSIDWGFGLAARGPAAAIWKVEKRPEKEEPCWPFGRAGFSKISMIDGEIVNYLLASLGWVSLLNVAGILPRSQCIPERVNPRVAFAQIELVR